MPLKPSKKLVYFYLVSLRKHKDSRSKKIDYSLTTVSGNNLLVIISFSFGKKPCRIKNKPKIRITILITRLIL